MKPLSIILWSVVAAALLLPGAAFGEKPAPFMSIAVTPVRQDIRPENIKQGDVVDFTITARSSADIAEAVISIELLGAERVSGAGSWIGRIAGGRPRELFLSIRRTSEKNGLIKARISLPGPNESSFSAVASYLLGSPDAPARKTAPSPRQRRDSKGKAILEYPAR